MYRIIKDGQVLSTEETARYTRRQRNGIDVLCTREEADGIVVNNDYVVSLLEVAIAEFNGVETLAEHENYYAAVSAEIGGE